MKIVMFVYFCLLLSYVIIPICWFFLKKSTLKNEDVRYRESFLGRSTSAVGLIADKQCSKFQKSDPVYECNRL